MKTTYLGLKLHTPVVVASSPYTASLPNIEACVKYGAGAVVLKSIFEEQVVRNAASLSWSDPGSGDAGEWLERYVGEAYKEEFRTLVREASQLGVPVIGSINCFSESPMWVEYAAALVEAGASALELNIFLLPTRRGESAAQIEERYIRIVGQVTRAVQVPVSVKLPMRLTNVLSVADSLLGEGARGVVLFNRFFEPDVDIERVRLVGSAPFSEPSELRNVLRSAALCASALPQLDIAVSTGVHDGEAAVKAILCGASVVQVCTAIHLHGYEVIGKIGGFIDHWAREHNFCSLDECRGRLDFGRADDDQFQRVQYMKYFPHTEQ